MYFNKETDELIASYGLVPLYNSSNIQKCFSLGSDDLNSSIISLQRLASA